MRETRQFDPGRRECKAVIALPHSGKTIEGTIRRFSLTGQHQFGADFYLRTATGPAALDFEQLVTLLLDELGHGVDASEADVKKAQMRERIGNSLATMADCVAQYQKRLTSGAPFVLDYIGSEQSLYWGHPFHACPKNLQAPGQVPFDDYRPEKQARFQLHYFGVKRSAVRQGWVAGYPPQLMANEADLAAGLLGESAEHYALLPMHPWQARFVLALPEIQRLLADEVLLDLGVYGGVYASHRVGQNSVARGYRLQLQVAPACADYQPCARQSGGGG